MLRQISTRQAGFVAFTGAVLSVYVGLALAHTYSGDRVILIGLFVMVACPLTWLIMSRSLGGYRNSNENSQLPENLSFPFLATLALISFIPEFWFGNPSWGRVTLVILLVGILWCVLFVIVTSMEAQRVLRSAESRSGWITGVIVGSHTIVFAGLLALRHYHFGAALGEDTGYYNQIFWNTLHGNFFEGSLTQERYNDPPVHSEFALHNSPVLFLILPFYWLAPSFTRCSLLRASHYPRRQYRYIF